MGRESESLLLYRPRMGIPEALMWIVFDICLTLFKFLAPAGLLILIAQNLWRITQGKSFLQHNFNSETLDALELRLESWLCIELIFYIYINIKAKRLSQKR